MSQMVSSLNVFASWFYLVGVSFSASFEGTVREDLQNEQLKLNSPFSFNGLNFLPHDLQTHIWSSISSTLLYDGFEIRMC